MAYMQDFMKTHRFTSDMLGNIHINNSVALIRDPLDVVLQRISLASWLAGVTATAGEFAYHPHIVGFHFIGYWVSLSHELRADLGQR